MELNFKITETAKSELERLLQERLPVAMGVRLWVESGAGGVVYSMSFADEVLPSEEVFKVGGVQLIAAKSAFPFLENIQLDFMAMGESSGFVFQNFCSPGVKSCLQCTGACYAGAR